MSKWKKFISLEIAIEIKACLYFGMILFFYFVFRVWRGSFTADIIQMTEMVLTAYVMNYLQVYVMHNFDEAEQFGVSVIIQCIVCSSLYAMASFFFGWYERIKAVSAGFFLYMLLSYLCTFFIFKIRRDLDTSRLNQELEDFKNRKKEVKD